MKERRYLKKSILLCGESDEGRFKRTFTIIKRLSGEGASCVCYEACHGGSGRGVLKEFYPRDAYGLERDAAGQLVCADGLEDAKERFRRAEQAYVEPYRMLLQAKREAAANRELAAFIPAFEIYHGCNEAGEQTGTTYIWMPDAKLETFDKICAEIHRRPAAAPERSLFTVLSAVESLTKCVCALHNAEMLHRDIKPDNFGFVKRGDETLTQTLSMFDINSICSVYHVPDVVTGPYTEPEAGYERASNQTDIYSIGAVLFHAVVVSDEVGEHQYLYRPAYYDRLRELVDSSRLIQASEANAHPRLRNILTVILQRCLCDRARRYAGCEELLEDIGTALYYALPSEIARKRRAGQQWVLTDVERSLDRHREKNSTLALQYHLYRCPLYSRAPEEEGEIRVLVVGFGSYGQKFLDVCLQAGQMRGRTLRVTVVSDDGADKDIYLAARPELTDFFAVDGALPGGEVYGHIRFEVRKLSRSDQKGNRAVLQEVIRCASAPPHYIFVALGEDRLNLAAARAGRMAVRALGAACEVHYVCEEDGGSCGEGLVPVRVSADIKEDPLYPEIERMALNTHLVWEKGLDLDSGAVRAAFRKPYNHDACVSSVLSLKYKLYSIGIDLDRCSFAEAAAAFAGRSEERSVKTELMYIEHRRWVTEKLCGGWRRIRRLDECLGGVTKDERRRRHVCIVPGRPDQKLAEEYSAGDYRKWDQASDSELDQLDELDRVSVELHRLFVRKASERRQSNLLGGGGIAELQTLIEGNREAVGAFQEWLVCLQNIWNGDREKVRLYRGLRDGFLCAAEGLPEERRRGVREQVKAFETAFYPILASMEYRDYKQNDAAAIDSIPFVLTYTEKVWMAVPLATGDNTEEFGNVAAATVVNPSAVLYLCLLERDEDARALAETLSHIAGYMRKKRLRAAVELAVACAEDLSPAVAASLAEDVRRAGGAIVRRVVCLPWRTPEELAAKLEAHMARRSRGKQVFALEKNCTRVSSILQGAGTYGRFPHYAFDSGRMEFCAMAECALFGYIQKRPHITVADMAAFRLSFCKNGAQPEFFDTYQELWRKYSERPWVWKQLCDLLGEYARRSDVLASFQQKPEREKSELAREYRYFLPFSCSRSAAKITAYLTECGIAERGSRVRGYTTDACAVTIVDRCGYRALYDQLFANVYALMQPDALSLYMTGRTRKAVVSFDDLTVSGVSVSGPRSGELCALMEFFRDKGYVIHLVEDGGSLSFTYATRRIKSLLTAAGKILEVYTYHKAKELGQFDDVVSGFELEWEGTEVKNEFDCVLTKGFRTLFVECKARPDIDQEFYFKLAGLVKQFGINATAVLIADTQERGQQAQRNAVQRMRGSMMDVVTVWKPEEIRDIGHTLLRIINGTYMSEEAMGCTSQNR